MAEQTEMDRLVEEMMEHICDELCRYPELCGYEAEGQEELERICAECKMGGYTCQILNAYNRDVTERQWISVEERLPKAKEDVLVCTKFGWILIAWYGPKGQRWHITPADAGITREDIAAWMPLPKPFNPQN